MTGPSITRDAGPSYTPWLIRYEAVTGHSVESMLVEQRTAPTRKPTIRDVAAAAGVSRGTVSRVINGGHWVSPEARTAVEAAIASTGYTANHAARTLATGRSNSLAFLLTEQHHLLFSDPAYSLLLRGAAEALARRAMTLVLLVAGTAEERANIASYVSAGHVDGVLLISSHAEDPLVGSLMDAGIPVVCSGEPLGLAGQLSSVSVDEKGSAREMTRHLLDRGHRRIAMIAGPLDTPGGRYRLDGFREELGDLFDPSLVEQGSWGRESGTAAMESLLARATDLDAVFAASDLMAAGAIAAATRAGVRVPDDIAVVGFDDSGLAAEHEPSITTMRQPWHELSEQMVTLLLEIIEGAAPRTIVLPTELVTRQSG